ncbi:hypothetical protein RvY_11998 [Ramazzottius varieornatus]|uniref:Uncharacterized protein n=1 Tax=Ramazzottius varieornatus TaxID=947166 RepID=A0A1D1VRT2_RAMVA|nr:hypothetical protein RvY_11998 [Ramazzottius varieornatus]
MFGVGGYPSENRRFYCLPSGMRSFQLGLSSFQLGISPDRIQSVQFASFPSTKFRSSTISQSTAVCMLSLRLFRLLNVLLGSALGNPVQKSCPTGCERMRRGLADCRNNDFSKWPEFSRKPMASIEQVNLRPN